MLASLPLGSPSPFLAYLGLEVRRTLRNRRYLVFTIAFPVTLYILYTAVLPATSSGPIDGLAWPVYFLVSMAAYGAMGAAMSQAAPIAAERRVGWARQLRVTPLPGPAYVGAKVVAAVVVTVPALVLVALAGLLVNHVTLAATSWILLVVAVALGSLPFAALGVLIGYVLDVESAQGGMVLAFFALAILGGLFAPLEAFPSALATIGHMLPSFHLASLGRAAVSGRAPDPADILVIAVFAVGLAGLAAWRYLADERAGRA